MALDSFKRVLWDANIKKNILKKKVSQFFVNRNYEGVVVEAGSVKINAVSPVVIKDYVPGTDIEYEELTTVDTTLIIDKSKYFAFNVDDVDAAQVASSGNLMLAASAQAADTIADDLDKLNFEAMVNSGTKLANASNVADATSAKALVLRMKTAADIANIPSEGRRLAASPFLENALLSDTTINLASPTTADSLRAGYIGKLYGIEIYSSNNTQFEGKEYAILTVDMATTEATQIDKLEAFRSENRFSDRVRGLSLSGRKVIYPELVIVAEVTYSNE